MSLVGSRRSSHDTSNANLDIFGEGSRHKLTSTLTRLHPAPATRHNWLNRHIFICRIKIYCLSLYFTSQFGQVILIFHINTSSKCIAIFHCKKKHQQHQQQLGYGLHVRSCGEVFSVHGCRSLPAPSVHTLWKPMMRISIKFLIQISYGCSVIQHITLTSKAQA